MGRSMGRRSPRSNTGGIALPRWCRPWWMNHEDGKLPSVLNQKATVTVPHMVYCTVTGIDFNSPHSHANGFPAQHTGLPSCFCSGRRFSCMQLKKEIISLLPALSASACPTNMDFAHRTLRLLSSLSQDSTAPHESVGQNTVSGSARVETVSMSAVLPRHRPS